MNSAMDCPYIPDYCVSNINMQLEMHTVALNNGHPTPQLGACNCQELYSNQQEKAINKQKSSSSPGYSASIPSRQEFSQIPFLSLNTIVPQILSELDEEFFNTVPITNYYPASFIIPTIKCSLCSSTINIEKGYALRPPTIYTDMDLVNYILKHLNQHKCSAQDPHIGTTVSQRKLCGQSDVMTSTEMSRPQKFTFLHIFQKDCVREYSKRISGYYSTSRTSSPYSLKTSRQNRQNNDIFTEMFFCHLCNHQCNRKSNLKRHLETHSTISKKPRCSFCEKGLSNNHNLKRHIKSCTMAPVDTAIHNL
ncbi:C2H2-type zinc finger transcription factor [Phycomyces blakesleeanus]|uniref:C2H2-type zinc finger transcription factor n=2 Tax=Phycomyces blakesleeanus TaxID=4837 RepID=A0A162N5J8_PHYB8|nr:C2H2-type zinc finger transcription factor [Phycomyces blakesleeanus NRRL 1555(-)]OAD66014.1 C2H2-type zinc finger transcription factor [Phycomyces blakesleeanus NRRL 1555(-)]|eukprot:XP_018284054.1 C2H2-type zinc finger transcription factor [Phycomyces blakesleeanus NRRL 1555(-)]